YAKSPVAVHHRCACSGLKELRNTSAARRQAVKLCYRFGPLTPSARSAKADRRRRDEERLSRSEQRTGFSPKQLLDTYSPIQLRIHCSPGGSDERTANQDRGLMVLRVAEGGPAAAGDILVAIAGKVVVRPSRIAQPFGPESIDQQLELSLLRAGTRLTLNA